ncbi:hypothetical protein [Shewanella sp. 10N.286.52.A9]|uniref:hypothetical protein n=1 Tax=Shewanella sp. 10N.286.52.A9 TaxID=3229711 RepID=UPI003552E1F7
MTALGSHISRALGAQVSMSLFQTILITVLLLGLSACVTTPHKPVPVKNGYSCFKEPSNFKDNYYLCVFELNTASPYYDDDLRAKLVDKFVESTNSSCTVIRTWEMIDATNHVEHAMFFINYRLKCT